VGAGLLLVHLVVLGCLALALEGGPALPASRDRLGMGSCSGAGGSEKPGPAQFFITCACSALSAGLCANFGAPGALGAAGEGEACWSALRCALLPPGGVADLSWGAAFLPVPGVLALYNRASDVSHADEETQPE
jgi:hypothetical protein